MNPFSPASLSPLPKTPLPCGLPYQLTWDDLRPILPGYDERESARAEAFASHDKQGLNGGSNSCILTLRYPTGENQLSSETIFIKHIADPEKAEAQKYQFIASRGVPTPRLLDTIHKDSAEIILLEFLPTIGIDFHSMNEVRNLLHVLAQLNSIQNPPDFFNPKPGGFPDLEFDEFIRSALIEVSHDRTLPFRIDIPRWLDAYHVAQRACDSMPSAVNHNEFFFQQVGWAQRDNTRQFVIFDLETMGLAPRFTDMAEILYPLSRYTGRDQLELFKIYFVKMCELNQLELGIDLAFHELRLVNIQGTFWSLPWIVDIARNSNVSEILGTTPAMAVTSLYHDLIALQLLE